MLAPLTCLVGECSLTKVTRATKTTTHYWSWDEVHQTVFNNMKALIARVATLAYTGCSREFEIYTDDYSKQLGAGIS
jgi:hypothetical protein